MDTLSNIDNIALVSLTFKSYMRFYDFFDDKLNRQNVYFELIAL